MFINASSEYEQHPEVRKQKLERVKKGLMNELLTGKKRIKAE